MLTIRDHHLRDLFAGDRDRGERLAVEAEDYLDYSKNRVIGETLRLLVQLAEDRGLRERIDAMFAGDTVNPTEDRAVLHVALRAPVASRIEVDSADVVAKVHDVLNGCRCSRSASARASGRARPASRSATWST
jgi:glucose-6-phosphate isomerase